MTNRRYQCQHGVDLDGGCPTCETNDRLGYDADVGDPSQYCEHGTFIGSWWGPDYLCANCEMGYDTLYSAVRLRREVWIDGQFTAAETVRKRSHDPRFWADLETDAGEKLFAASVERDGAGRRRLVLTSTSDPNVRIVYFCEKYMYWGPPKGEGA